MALTKQLPRLRNDQCRFIHHEEHERESVTNLTSHHHEWFRTNLQKGKWDLSGPNLKAESPPPKLTTPRCCSIQKLQAAGSSSPTISTPRSHNARTPTISTPTSERRKRATIKRERVGRERPATARSRAPELGVETPFVAFESPLSLTAVLSRIRHCFRNSLLFYLTGFNIYFFFFLTTFIWFSSVFLFFLFSFIFLLSSTIIEEK